MRRFAMAKGRSALVWVTVEWFTLSRTWLSQHTFRQHHSNASSAWARDCRGCRR